MGAVRRLTASVLLMFGVLSWATSAVADARTDYLRRLLETSSSFRVRAQAAMSLGRIEGDAQVVKTLADALGDDHPAVRAAVASSLERLGDPSVLDALQKAKRDRDDAVRRAIERAIRKLERIARTRPRRDQGDSARPSPGGGQSRFYVGVGMPGSSDANVGGDVLERARRYIEEQVRGIDGAVVAPRDESRRQVQRTLAQRDLTGYYIDSSVVRVEDKPDGTRVVVSVILNTYPGRDMRAMLQGAATVPGARGREARSQALEGALRGALRRLPQALEASAARDGR